MHSIILLMRILMEKDQNKKYNVHFMSSSSYEDLISSEGELPKIIQTHLEWRVIQAMFDMRGIIESKYCMYRKNSEDTFQGPDAIRESLEKRFMDIFLRNRECISDVLLGNFVFPKETLNCDKIAQVLLENLAQVMQCFTVEVLATIYGLKEYHLHNMLEEAQFKEECATIIGWCIKDKLLQLLKPVFPHSPSVQLKTMRDKLSDQFSKQEDNKMLDELKQIDYTKIANLAHKTLEEKIQPVMRNLLIQDKLKFEINSVLKQIVASNYKSYKLSPSIDLGNELRNDLLSIAGVKHVMMVCGELQVHCTEYSSVENEKAVHEKIKEVIAEHRYSKNYKIGVVTKEPEQFYSVGSTLHSPVLNRRGTLGGYVKDIDGQLYCLTCAHVVPNDTDVQVEIRGQDIGPVTIGKSVIIKDPPERLRISVDCVDIMAVRIDPKQIQRCNLYFKTPDGEYSPCVQIHPFDSSLRELHNIYKWGATTNISFGLLHTGESNVELFTQICLNNQKKHVNVFVEPLPVDDDRQGPFAKPGDSGAIICAETLNKLQIIAMIQGGDMFVKTGLLLTNYTTGFYVWCGLDKLLMRSGLNLHLP
ncbi:hypothetical protein ACJMK2_011780 [Sinanodonta woodiana]|uniref:Uncharacterized protein n=1 Tax=Sinanodonta woodiana TaxID=1069815 RepID=A0ABD3V645_SINWO